jgi:ADP-ribose pyrophosphatase YjhB (NUDIX family)
MLIDFVFRVWRRLSGPLQWRTLWLVNSKFMVSVSGAVYDAQGRVLLQRHRHWVPDVWGLPGGIVRSGERLEGAFAREVREETGLAITDVTLVRVVSGYRVRLEVLFRARIDETMPLEMKLQEKEVLEARFFPVDALPDKMLPEQRELLERVDRC